VWAALLLPGAVYVPLGGNQTETSRSTLAHDNGYGILILVAVPLLLSCLAGIYLLVQAKTGSPVAQRAAWVCAGAVLIGIFVVPGGASTPVRALRPDWADGAHLFPLRHLRQ